MRSWVDNFFRALHIWLSVVASFRGLECVGRIIYCWQRAVDDALISPSFCCLFEFGGRGGGGIVEEALNTCPARTASDHAEAMLQRERGGELKAPGLNASYEYGRGECVLPCAIVRSAADRFGWEVKEGGP